MEEASNPLPSPSGVNKAVLRVAWWVIGAGVLVALSAAITGGMNPDAKVLPVRNLAAMIMLIGLVMVLGAYRAAWLRQVWERSEMTAQVNPNQPRRRNDWTLPLVIVLSLLLGGAFFVVAVVSLVGGIVSAYAILLLRAMILAALVSLLVYGKGYPADLLPGGDRPGGAASRQWDWFGDALYAAIRLAAVGFRQPGKQPRVADPDRALGVGRRGGGDGRAIPGREFAGFAPKGVMSPPSACRGYGGYRH